MFGKPELKIEPITLPVQVYFPDSRPFVPPDLVAQARAKIEKAESDLKKAKEKPEAAPLIEAAVKRVEAAKAALPALEARIQADLASLKTPVPENSEKLAEEARRLEMAANRLQAEADIITAKYDFELGKTNEKKLASATAKLESAVKALKEPAEGYTPIGTKFRRRVPDAVSRWRAGSHQRTIRSLRVWLSTTCGSAISASRWWLRSSISDAAERPRRIRSCWTGSRSSSWIAIGT